MFQDYIYDKLKKGASPEDVANEMADMLNEQLTRVQEEKEAEERAKSRSADKAAHAEAIINALADYYATYYPEFKVNFEGDPEKLLDSMCGLCEAMADLRESSRNLFGGFDWLDNSLLENWFGKAKEETKRITKDNAIDRFLKQNGLK